MERFPVKNIGVSGGLFVSGQSKALILSIWLELPTGHCIRLPFRCFLQSHRSLVVCAGWISYNTLR
ncbi:MAG TPA: hypothetical protein DCF63_05440 [Planctomycetaceae bacterium]|nr:hypothetical protein [Planctomycetaceae bacterium]